jgi:hypothetical protein
MSAKSCSRNSFTTFGTGRESYNKVVSHKGCNYEVNDPKVPGPTKYHPLYLSQKDKFTMRPKTVNDCK